MAHVQSRSEDVLEDVHDLGGEKTDETYIGGKWRGKLNRGKYYTGGSGKMIVAGLVERGGRVTAYPIESRNWFELSQPIKEKVKPGSTIYTDEALQYNPLRKWGFAHGKVKHLEGVYVEGNVSTNTIEGY